MSVPRNYTATSLEEKWRARTVPTEGGHLLWTGWKDLNWQGRNHKATRIAFTMRTGRQPTGKVLPDCGMTGCVAPEHVDDQPGRQRTRTQLRAVYGHGERPPRCANGHEQITHGRFTPDGRAYCNACTCRRREGSALLRGPARMKVARELQARYYAGESIKGIAQSIGRTYGYVRALLQFADTEFRNRGYHAQFHAPKEAAA